MKNDIFNKSVDLNGDNRLDMAEFKQWYKPSIYSIVNNEEEYLYECCDADRDGYFSKNEINNGCEKFFQSQITDYGEELEPNTNMNARLRDEF